jgi:hypothetical protein
MEKIPTAREFYDAHYSDDAVVMMIDFAKMHVEAALAEVGCKIIGPAAGSIKDMYPLENIK